MYTTRLPLLKVMFYPCAGNLQNSFPIKIAKFPEVLRKIVWWGWMGEVFQNGGPEFGESGTIIVALFSACNSGSIFEGKSHAKLHEKRIKWTGSIQNITM